MVKIGKLATSVALSCALFSSLNAATISASDVSSVSVFGSDVDFKTGTTATTTGDLDLTNPTDLNIVVNFNSSRATTLTTGITYLGVIIEDAVASSRRLVAMVPVTLGGDMANPTASVANGAIATVIARNALGETVQINDITDTTTGSSSLLAGRSHAVNVSGSSLTYDLLPLFRDNLDSSYKTSGSLYYDLVNDSESAGDYNVKFFLYGANELSSSTTAGTGFGAAIDLDGTYGITSMSTDVAAVSTQVTVTGFDLVTETTTTTPDTGGGGDFGGGTDFDNPFDNITGGDGTDLPGDGTDLPGDGTDLPGDGTDGGDIIVDIPGFDFDFDDFVASELDTGFSTAGLLESLADLADAISEDGTLSNLFEFGEGVSSSFIFDPAFADFNPSAGEDGSIKFDYSSFVFDDLDAEFSDVDVISTINPNGTISSDMKFVLADGTEVINEIDFGFAGASFKMSEDGSSLVFADLLDEELGTITTSVVSKKDGSVESGLKVTGKDGKVVETTVKVGIVGSKVSVDKSGNQKTNSIFRATAADGSNIVVEQIINSKKDGSVASSVSVGGVTTKVGMNNPGVSVTVDKSGNQTYGSKATNGTTVSTTVSGNGSIGVLSFTGGATPAVPTAPLNAGCELYLSGNKVNMVLSSFSSLSFN